MSAPVVSALDIASGPAGEQVLVMGSGFLGATAIHFGASSCGTNFAVVSDTDLLCYPPAGSGTVHVTVTTPGGTSATSSADQFTYAASPGGPGGGGSAPTVTGVAPSSTTDPDGGDTVVITGTGFTTATAVFFGGSQAVFVVDSDAQVTATAPPGSGLVDVTVQNAYGTSATSSADQFTYPTMAAPTITGISPSSGATGAVITITGTVLAGVTSVLFGTVAAAFSVISDTSLTAVAPSGVTGAVDVTATSAGGTSATSSADVFTYGALGTAPVTTATMGGIAVPSTPFDGYATSPQTVTISVVSGSVSAIYYTLDGTLHTYSGPFAVSGAGSHTLTWWGVGSDGTVEVLHVGYVNLITAGAVPTDLKAVAIGTGTILLSWDQVTGLSVYSYRVYSGPTSSPANLVLQTNASVVSIPQTSCVGMGYGGIGASDYSGWANYKTGAKATLDVATSINTMMFSHHGNTAVGHAACNVRAMIYADSAGAPGSPLATSNAVAIADNAAAGLVTLTFASPPSLAAGTYWLAVIFDANAGGLKLAYDDDGSSPASVYNANTYTSGPSNPFGAGTASAVHHYCISAQGAVGNPMYYAVSSVTQGGVESAKCTAVGPVTAGLITTTDITPDAITTPLLRANCVTADEMATGTITAASGIIGDLTADVITAGTLSGRAIAACTIDASSIITGALIRTAASGQRVEVNEVGGMGEVSFYSADSAEAYHALINHFAPSPGVLQTSIQGAAVAGSNTPIVYLSNQSTGSYIGIDTGNGASIVLGGPVATAPNTIAMVGSVKVSGSVKPSVNWASGVSDDGMWIQEAASGKQSRRYKLYFDASAARLVIRLDGSTYANFAPTFNNL